MPGNSTIQQFLGRFDGERRRDTARIAVQTVAASAAVYLVMRWAGLPGTSWAVISALFVIHLNFDSTLSAATGRLAATVLGSGLALGLVQLAGGPELAPGPTTAGRPLRGGAAPLRPLPRLQSHAT